MSFEQTGLRLRVPHPLLILTVALVLGVAAWLIPTWRQASEVAAIERVGGEVSYASTSEITELGWNFHDTGDTAPTTLDYWVDEPDAILAGIGRLARRPFVVDAWDRPIAVELRKGNATVESLRAIAALSSLRLLSLWSCELDPAEFASSFGGRRGLRWLELSQTAIDDRALSVVERMPDLEWLDLTETRITDEGLRSLEGLKGLRVLILSRTAVTDAGVSRLRNLTSLERLELAETTVSDAAIDKLLQLTKLRRLDLDGTRVTPACMSRLVGLPNLDRLKVSSTVIKEHDADEFRTKRPSVFVTAEFIPL